MGGLVERDHPGTFRQRESGCAKYAAMRNLVCSTSLMVSLAGWRGATLSPCAREP